MRLIDVGHEIERLLDFIMQNNTGIQYAIEHKNKEMLSDILFFYFDSQRNYLENVIDHINSEISPTDCYRHKYCENMSDKKCVRHEDCEFCVADKIIEILKSAINFDNSRNK